MIMEPKEKKVYTIDDIARELGVSKTTVSRAISGKGRIGQTTREKVLSFIEEHDYRPNVMAKGLAQRKTFNLALLLPKDIIPPGPPFPMELIIFLLSQRPRRIKIAIGSTYPRIRDKSRDCLCGAVPSILTPAS